VRDRSLTLRTAFIAVTIAASAIPACQKKAPLGSPCRADDDCASGLACHHDQCLQSDSARRMREEDQRASGREAPGGHARKVGDRVEVEWKGTYRPATIIGIVAPGSYRVHFEGHDAQWDEVVTEIRIKGGARGGGDDNNTAAPAASASAG
jgi:hypothetical protein